MRRSIRIAVCLTALSPARIVLAAGDIDDGSDRGGTVKVDVVVDMTEAGKKIVPPTPDKPVYYLPVPSGYEEVGYAPFFQRPLPPASEVEKFIEKEFAAQGYRVLVKGSHPSLVMEFAWGYMAPTSEFNRHSKLDGIPPGWIQTLLFGDTVNSGDPVGDRRTLDDLKQMMNEHRGFYYVIVSAFDFQDVLHHKATLLWRAHISTMIWGHYFDQVLPTMIMTAAPMLGHETRRPRLTSEPVIPMGQVIVGTPVLKPDAPAAAEPKAAP